MSPEQAFQFLKSILVLRAGVDIDQAAASVQAWNIVWQALRPKPPEPPKAPETKPE